MQPIEHAWALLKQERRRLGPAPGSTEEFTRRMSRNTAPSKDDEGLYRLGPQKGTPEYAARQMENLNRPPQSPAPPREPRWGNDLVQENDARFNAPPFVSGPMPTAEDIQE